MRIVLAALAFALCAAAAAQEPPVDPVTGKSIEAFPVAPAALEAPPPVYPPAAEQAGVEGAVRAILTLDTAGTVTAVDIAAETPPGQGFATAAAAALKTWRFPAGAAGRYRIKVTFNLPDAPAPLPDAPRPIKRTMPRYPAEAWKAGISGEAVVRAEIRRDGRVHDTTLLAETPPGQGFGDAAVQAVKKWTFPEDLTGTYQVRVKFEYQPDVAPDGAAVPPAPKPVKRGRMRYPLAAFAAGGISGQVDAIITIDGAGHVTHVETVYEHPPGYGFAEETAKGLPSFEFPPGAPGRYAFSINFVMEDGADPVAVDIGALPPAPEPWRRITPVYPADAKAKGLEGAAEVAVFLEHGRVTNALLIGENPEGHGFGGAAYDAVIRWRWADTPDGAYRVRVEFRKGQ